MVEAIAIQLEKTSAETNMSESIKGLTRAGHVAALLRY
jgi:hypothetical protein